MLRGRKQRAPFDRRDISENAHQRAAAEMRETAACFAHKMGQHLFGSFEVGNDTIEQRCDDADSTRLASVLLLCFKANRDHFSGDRIDSHERWFIYHDATAAHGDDGRCRSHVYRH